MGRSVRGKEAWRGRSEEEEAKILGHSGKREARTASKEMEHRHEEGSFGVMGDGGKKSMAGEGRRGRVMEGTGRKKCVVKGH